jgi:hypothetical protein
LAEAFDAWMAFDNFTLAIQADHLRSTSSLWSFFSSHSTYVRLRVSWVKIITFILALRLLLKLIEKTFLFHSLSEW